MNNIEDIIEECKELEGILCNSEFNNIQNNETFIKGKYYNLKS